MSGVPLSKFPFLIDDPIKRINETENIFIENEVELFLTHRELVERALNEALIGKGELWEKLSEVEETAIVFSLMWVASLLNNPAFSNRIAIYLAKKYSKRVSELLKRGTINLSNIIDMANMLGMPIKMENVNKHVVYLGESYKRSGISAIMRQYSIVMSLPAFLSLTKRLKGDPKYKLTNRILVDGKVLLSPTDTHFIIRLLEERFVGYILDLIEKFSTSASVFKLMENEEVIEIIEKAKQQIPKRTISMGAQRVGSVREDAFPPCMAKIFRDLTSGGNLTHHQRFVVVAFLGHIGMSENEIIELFRGLPDFNERITSYQVRHILGGIGGRKKYLPYSCEKMRALGLCVADCNVKSPLQYYYMKARAKHGDKRDSAARL